jgi:hypothetical protein
MKTTKKLFTVAIFAIFSLAYGYAQCDCPPLAYRDSVFSSDLVDANDNLLSSATTWTCDNLYILDSRVYVNNGLTLTIEPGTVIKAQETAPGAAFSVIVTRGSRIVADGNAECPIIFTTVLDPLDGSYPLCNTKKWGGIIILGRAYNNVLDVDAHPSGDPIGIADGVGTIEGLYHPDPRHHYGADLKGSVPPEWGGTGIPESFVDNDNSGILRYVSVRHGGAVIGAANEINGITLGSVGSGTIIENVEVISNEDDGIEFFGGTVNCKWATLVFNQDDYIDYDQGYKGKIQFVLAVRNPDITNPLGDHGIEGDGDDGAVPGRTRNSYPLIYNLTALGANKSGDPAYEAKERTLGEVKNSVFANYDYGVRMAEAVVDSFLADKFILQNNTFLNCTPNLEINAADPDRAAAITKFDGAGNITETGTGIDYSWTSAGNPVCVLTGTFNAVPWAGRCSSTISAPNDGFFSPVSYRGAFEPGKKPWNEWTLTYQEGYDGSSAPCPSDLDGDNDTDVNDFNVFSNRFGQPCGAY